MTGAEWLLVGKVLGGVFSLGWVLFILVAVWLSVYDYRKERHTTEANVISASVVVGLTVLAIAFLVWAV